MESTKNIQKRENPLNANRRNFGEASPMPFASSKLQKTMKLRAQQRHRATVTQPLQCDLQALSCKRPWNYVRTSNAEQPWCSSHSNAICILAKTCSKTGSRHQSRKKVRCWSLFKRNCKGKWNAPKTKKSTKKYVATSTHFVRDFLQNLKVQLVKRKLLCETSLKNWKLSMWKGSFCARHPQETVSWTCANEAFVQYFPQKLKS